VSGCLYVRDVGDLEVLLLSRSSNRRHSSKQTFCSRPRHLTIADVLCCDEITEQTVISGKSIVYGLQFVAMQGSDIYGTKKLQ